MPSSSLSPTDPQSFALPRTARVIRAWEFRRVYGRGQRARGQAMVVVAARRRDPGHRLGLSVSKEHGHAVRRNQIKRLLREAFRLERPGLAGQFDLVLIPIRRDGKYTLDELRRELAHLVHKIETRPPQQGNRRRGRGRSRKSKGPAKPTS